MVDRGEHDLGIFFHYLLSLQLFLGTYVSERKNDLLLTTKVLGFNAHIIEYAIYRPTLLLFC